MPSVSKNDPLLSPPATSPHPHHTQQSTAPHTHISSPTHTTRNNQHRQTAVVRKDFGVANALLPNIPESELSNVARFLESQGYKEEALVVSRCVG
jgi:hypothetical protein